VRDFGRRHDFPSACCQIPTNDKSPLPCRNIVSISPDGHWLLCFRHYGSRWQENYLYHSNDGVQFVPAQELIVAGGAEKVVASRFQKTAPC